VPITGIAELRYAVEDLDKCIRFFEDFGLSKLESRSDHAVFEVVSGQRVHLFRLGDSRLPKSAILGPGVHECVWAVDNQADLDGLVSDLSRDHEVVTDAQGVVHFVTAFGQAIGLRVFQRRPLVGTPSPANSPAIVNRVNVPRKWPSRAIPKTINHLVWGFLDVNATFAFYRDRLGFKLSDVQKGVGMYIRAGRCMNHHNIALADANSTAFGFSGKFEFHHVNFGVDDVDEIMAGKNYLERRGYKDNGWGLGRHRISSELFLYIPSPAGGEVEYGADCDQLDDQWQPRLWGATFAAFAFIHDMPEWLKPLEPDWDVSYVDADTAYYEPVKP
jgi:catechol 2,3-dioxygenase-like lactoylglutathione lyase family enzyme